MSSPLYTILHLFASVQALGYLAEIARSELNRPGTTVREWIWIEARRAITLQPLTGGTSAFEEGQLSLDGNRGELRWRHGRCDSLQRLDPDVLPASSRRLLELHLT